MPFMKKVNGKSVRDYGREKRWDHEHKGGQRIRDRAKRNAARKIMGLEKGSGTQVDHIRSLFSGGSNNRSNLRVTSARTNLEKEAKAKKARAKKGK